MNILDRTKYYWWTIPFCHCVGRDLLENLEQLGEIDLFLMLFYSAAAIISIVLKYDCFKSRDDIFQLMRQCSGLFGQEKLLKPNRWQSIIHKHFV